MAGELPRLNWANIRVLGSFKVPLTTTGGVSTAMNGGFGAGYIASSVSAGNSGNPGLYLCASSLGGVTSRNTIYEVNIPTLVNSSVLGDLNEATITQDAVDPSEHLLQDFNDQDQGNYRIGGILPYDNGTGNGVQLYVSFGRVYDGGGTVSDWIFRRPPDLSDTGHVNGPQGTNGEIGSGGRHTSSLQLIPPEYGVQLPTATSSVSTVGNCDMTLSIMARQSSGPNLNVGDPIQWDRTGVAGSPFASGYHGSMTAGSAIVNLAADSPNLSGVVDGGHFLQTNVTYGQGANKGLDPADPKIRWNKILSHTSTTVTCEYTWSTTLSNVRWGIGGWDMEDKMYYDGGSGHYVYMGADVNGPPGGQWNGTDVFWNESFRNMHFVWPFGTRTLIYIMRGHFGTFNYAIPTDTTFDANHSRPNPPLTVQWPTGNNASVSSDGLTITLPFNSLSDGGNIGVAEDKVFRLVGETTPVQNPGSNTAVRWGCSPVQTSGNPGAANAFVTVKGPAFTAQAGMSGFSYEMGEARAYDPVENSGQGYRCFPYATVAMLVDADDIVAGPHVYSPFPYALIPLTNTPGPEPRSLPFNEQGAAPLLPFPSYSSDMYGVAHDPVGQRIFLVTPSNVGGAPVVTVWTYANASATEGVMISSTHGLLRSSSRGLLVANS